MLTMLNLATKANPVDVSQARLIGATFLHANNVLKTEDPSDLHWVTTYRTTSDKAAFYVFSSSHGFVIVAADDCAVPILGYSNESDFMSDDIPVQMEEYLQQFVNQIQFGIDNGWEADETIARQWELVRTTGYLDEQRGVSVVAPLLTDTWGQNCYYNNACPVDPSGSCGHVNAGCVATSMAQIMRYWGYPSMGTGSHSYTQEGYSTQTADFGGTTYQWANMPNKLSSSSSVSQVNAVAKLIWHCGVAVDMMYGPTVSGAYSEAVTTALLDYFSYSDDLIGVYKNNYSNSQWLAIIKSSLDLGRPVHYSGNDGTGQLGHAFVCDGYDSNDMFHFNWGWNGNYNSYFALDALTPGINNFCYNHYAIIHIHPKCNPDSTYQVGAIANHSDGGTISGGGTYECNEICTLTATPHTGFVFTHWTKNGNTVSTNPAYSFVVTEETTVVANFNELNVAYGELDYSWYDWQSNAGARTWTHVWPDGKVSFGYSMATESDCSDRGTGIGTYDTQNDVWIPSGGRVENEKTGFGSIAQFGENGVVIAANTDTACLVFIVPDKDNIIPNTVTAVCALDNTYDPSWPVVMTSGPNRNIIHIAVTAKGHSDVPGAVGTTNPVIYFRSQDGGQTWDKQNVILPFMGPEFSMYFSANCCYWMETTDDNCLALVVNNPWSDGMALYSYDDGETWERKVFYSHPDPHSAVPEGEWLFFPRWTSCQWDSQHRLHVLYEFAAITGEPGSFSYNLSIGGVAYWNETMPYNIEGNTTSTIPGNLTPGQPFVMDAAYLYQDIFASWWLLSDASHEMWPEYVGYLAPLDDGGYPEDPYAANSFNIEDCGLHGNYGSGVCGFPVLTIVPGTNEMVAVWSALDENHTDVNGNYYYKLFASYSGNGGETWSSMIHLTNDWIWSNNEFVYNQAVIVGRKLIIASQTDHETGTYVQSDDNDGSDNYYQGFVFDIDDLFDIPPQYTITVSANPADLGTVTGGGNYFAGGICTLTATSCENAVFVNWTENGDEISTETSLSFVVTGNRQFTANFTAAPAPQYTITVTADPANLGVVTGGGDYEEGSTCSLTAIPNTGNVFTHWTENGNPVSTNPQYSFIVTENASFVAHFTMQTFEVELNVSPADGGVVNGSGIYTYGATATVSVTPGQNYNFVNWTENGTEVSTETSFSFVVTENRQLIANLSFVSSVSQNEAGGVLVYPNPVPDMLTVEAAEPILKCDVYSFDGTHVFSTVSNNRDKKLNLDVKHFSSGTYLIRLTTEEAVLIRKFIKK